MCHSVPGDLCAHHCDSVLIGARNGSHSTQWMKLSEWARERVSKKKRNVHYLLVNNSRHMWMASTSIERYLFMFIYGFRSHVNCTWTATLPSTVRRTYAQFQWRCIFWMEIYMFLSMHWVPATSACLKSNARKTSRDIAGKNTKVDYLNTHCIFSVDFNVYIVRCVCLYIERSPLATRPARDGRISYETSFVSFLAIQFNLRLLLYFDLLL